MYVIHGIYVVVIVGWVCPPNTPDTASLIHGIYVVVIVGWVCPPNRPDTAPLIQDRIFWEFVRTQDIFLPHW